MSQLGTLLWKNFRWCRRHWLWTLMFFVVPIVFCGFLLMIVKLIAIQNLGDCDHVTFALPPSSPAAMVASLVCRTDTDCANASAGYIPPRALLNVTRMSNNITIENQWTMLCTGLKVVDANALFIQTVYSTCADRKLDAKYTDFKQVDFVFRGMLLYYPQTDATAKLVSLMAKYLDGIEDLKVGGLLIANTSNIERIATLASLLGQVSACYQPLATRTMGFADRSSALSYAQKLNISTTIVWGVVAWENVGDDFTYSLTSAYQLRTTVSALYLQALAEVSIIDYLTNNSVIDLNLETNLLPKRCHKDPKVYNPAYGVIQIVTTMGMVVLAYSIASEICFEKNAGLLEFLFIAGVKRSTVKVAWFIFGLIFFLMLAVILALIIKYINADLIEHTPLSVLLVFLILYCTALLCLCFLVSSLVATAQQAGIVMFVLLLIAYLAPNWAQIVPSVGYTGGKTWTARIASLIHCGVTVQIGFAYIIKWETIELGAQWASLSDSPVDEDEFGGLLECCIHLLIQIVYYMLLSLYFDLVAPSKYGFKLPWYFPFSPTFWCGTRAKVADINAEGISSTADIEPLKSPKEPGISVIELTKSYGKDKIAVDRLSVNFYRNEITAILGHNGAGKSTTINMLTGMIGSSSGTAIIDGKDIHKEMKAIRHSLGFCPQYDIIYPELTVKEHMKFYGDLKGIDPKQVELYSNDLFTLMKMDHALKKPAGTLSGGMKRKLSITIAFLGDPTTIILDEPTSAIDPFSRRAIWDVVLRYRAKSTVVISTHYMQEADILGDRIAIINHGVLKCSGSTMYLKAKYGSGFYLNLAHREAISAHKLEKRLKKFIPVSLTSSTDTETTYSVPLAAARSKAMISACAYLEDHAEEQGVVSFGISESTMEQVFFNVAADVVDDVDKTAGGNDATALSKIGYENINGLQLTNLHVWATWIKRFHLMKRSKLGFVFQVLVPLLFTAIMIFLNNVVAGSGINGERIMMEPWNTSFVHGKLLFAGPPDSTLAQSVLTYDFGTICMNKIAGLTCNATVSPMPSATTDVGVKDCECSQCPVDAAGQEPNFVQLRGGDQLYNLYGRNATTFMLKTSDKNVYASVEIMDDGQSVDPAVACVQMVDALTFPQSSSAVCNNNLFGLDSESAMTASGILQLAHIFASTAKTTHIVTAGVIPADAGSLTTWETDNRNMRSAFLNAYNNAQLRSRLMSTGYNYGITLYTEEASLTNGVSLAQSIAGILLGFFSAFALMMPSFATMLVIVNERSSGNKQMQFLMGLNRVAYWLANFVWDELLYIFSIAIVVGFMAIFPETFQLSLGNFFVVALMFSVGLLLTSYNLSFVIKAARSAILLVGMLVPVFTVSAMVLLNWSDESWYPPVDTVLTFFPPYFICISLILLSLNEFAPAPQPTYGWDILGKRLAIGGLYIAVMVLLLIFFEFEVHKRLNSCKMRRRRRIGIDLKERIGKDPDVLREEEDVLNAKVRPRQSVLAVRRLQKTYGNGHTAVKDVTFCVQKGECFGLLGVNGAGKSTLFNMLTGFHHPTAGDATVLGYSIFGNAAQVAKHVSYCPQTDTLFESLTSEEHLFLYARIRGVPSNERQEVVEAMVQEVGLTPHRGKQSQSLSGGNKRKLNFAIAMLDFPDVIFLDEMTTGMDPKARRSAWNCLQKAIQMGCAAVITSHSMEECESLCNRLVIMVNGQFRCIGGVQYLKDKFGRYYNMKFRLKDNANPMEVQTRLETRFPGTQVVEEHLGYIELQCPAEQLKLSHLLAVIHEHKRILGIEDFSVSQTTLEHVFVNMVRDQE